MKQVLYTAAILMMWVVENPYDLRHKTSGYLKEEIKPTQEQFKPTLTSSSTRLKVETLQNEVRSIRSTRGDADAELYRYCHTYTAGNEKERKHCARLDRQVEKFLKH